MQLKFEGGVNVSPERIVVVAELKESKGLEDSYKQVEPFVEELNKLRADNPGSIDNVFVRPGRLWTSQGTKYDVKLVQIKVMLNQRLKKPETVKNELKATIKPMIEKYRTEKFTSLAFYNRGDESDKSNVSETPIFIYGSEHVAYQELQSAIDSQFESQKGLSLSPVEVDVMEKIWRFKLNASKLGQYGISPQTLSHQLRTILAEARLEDLRMNGMNYRVYTKLDKTMKDFKFEELNKVQVLSSKGYSVPLSYLGHWEQVNAPKKIKRYNGRRAIEFMVNYDEEVFDKEQARKAIDESLKPLTAKFPAYQFSTEPVLDSEEDSKKWAINIAVTCIILILLTLAIILGNLTQMIIVGLAIPFGVVGVVLAYYFHDMTLNIIGVIGIMGVAGVAVNDSLIMVDSINNIQKSEDRKRMFQMDIIAGAVSRFRPIIITTLTTLSGVFPMAYGWVGESGFTAPLAFSMAWGLTTATLLTLFLVPVLLEIRLDVFRVWAWGIHKLKRNKKVLADELVHQPV